MAIGTISVPATWLNGTVAPAAWFQNVQDNVNAFIAGTESYKALQVDGTGGIAVAPTSGSIVASGNIGGATLTTTTGASGGALPTPSFTFGTVYKDITPIAWAYVAANGSLSRGANIGAITHTISSGIYAFQMNTGTISSSTQCVVVSLVNTIGFATGAPQTSTTFNVNTYNTSSTLTDASFAVIVCGA